jgi:hypothetical protein
VVGELTGGDGERRRGVQAVAEGLLGHLRQTALQGAIGNGGAPSRPGRTGIGQRKQEGEGRSDVWEGDGNGVSSNAWSGGGV